MVAKPRLFVFALFISVGHAACTADTASLGPSAVSIISNTEWVLVQLDGEAVNPGGRETAPTLAFSSDDTRASGFAGCNRFSTRYEMDADQLAFSQMAMTRMFCGGRMDLERRFVAALEATRTYRVSASILDLIGSQGVLARFSRR